MAFPHRLGAHVRDADPVAAATLRDAGLAQFFLGDPQGWADPVVEYDGGAEQLKDKAAAADVDLYVHAPYRINVATPNNRIRIPSRTLLQKHVDAAAEIGARAIVVHGGHVGADADPEAGVANWVKCVERLRMPLPVLIENTAGGDNAMARRLERIDRLWDAVGRSGVGFCLDTCHAWAGGIDLTDVVERVRAITGRIDLLHANDSRDGFDSGADRHANLGAGKIDPDELAAAVGQAGAPVVVETPGEVEGQSRDLAWLRERLG